MLVAMVTVTVTLRVAFGLLHSAWIIPGRPDRDVLRLRGPLGHTCLNTDDSVRPHGPSLALPPQRRVESIA